MSEMSAITILSDKFWILLKNSEKIGTMSYNPETNLYLIKISTPENSEYTVESARISEHVKLPDLKKTRENDEVSTPAAKSVASKPTNLNGYPVKSAVYNAKYDQTVRGHTFCKISKSTVRYVAGYYVVQFSSQLILVLCPKLSTLLDNNFHGPYMTKLEGNEQLRKLKHGGISNNS